MSTNRVASKLKISSIVPSTFLPYIQLFLATADDSEDYNGAVEAATTLTGLHFMFCSIRVGQSSKYSQSIQRDVKLIKGGLISESFSHWPALFSQKLF
jgi:hypothetical protein